jgi:nicotinamide riboside kinase
VVKIAIDGAQCTGKTTLFEQLQQTQLSETFRFIPEASRSVAEEFGIRSTTDWPLLLSDHERLGQFFLREERWLATESGVLERFIVDSSYYLIQAYKCHTLGQKFDLPSTAPEYDLILYCPCTNDFQDDGFRFSTGRDGVDRAYRDAMSTIRATRVVELPVGVARKQIALDAIADVIRHSASS